MTRILEAFHNIQRGKPVVFICNFRNTHFLRKIPWECPKLTKCTKTYCHVYCKCFFVDYKNAEELNHNKILKLYLTIFMTKKCSIFQNPPLSHCLVFIIILSVQNIQVVNKAIIFLCLKKIYYLKKG